MVINMLNKRTFILIFLFLFLSNPNILYAQTDTLDSSTVTIDTVLNDISDLIERIKTNNKDKASKTKVRKLLVLKRKLDKAVKLIPPDKCNELFKEGTYDFYALVSKLSEGISCGPPIIPPFDLEPSTAQTVGPDCLPPSEKLYNQIRVNIFSECYGIYQKLRELYSTDLNENGISDVCE